MNKLTVLAAALVCFIGVISSQAEASDMDLDQIASGLKEVEAAKAKLSAMDAKLAKAAEAFGPEGKEIYDALKKKAKVALKKGISWLKKKFSDKMAAKRMAEMKKRDWDDEFIPGAVTETEKRMAAMKKRDWDDEFVPGASTETEKRTADGEEWSPEDEMELTETEKRTVKRDWDDEFVPGASTETEKRTAHRM